MKKVVVDTDILIDHLHAISSAEKVITKVRSREIIGYISGITEAELLSGKECNDLVKLNKVMEFIRIFTKIDVVNKITQKAGEYVRKYDVELPDAIVAATAYYQKAVIWSRNIGDFRKIKEVKVFKPY